MSTAAGPDASDNGLSFYLDAGNYRSYPGSGTSWFDLSGNSNTGTLTNGPTYSAVFGGSIVFDGVDDYISVSDSTTTNFTTEESFSIWFYQTNTVASWAGLIGKGTSDANEQYCLLLNADRQNLYWDIGAGSGPYVQPVLSSAYKLNTWHNIVATHIRTAGSSTLKIYFNGNLITASTISPTQGPNTSASPLTIGGSRVGGANFFFPGHISQVQLFNRELNATEILQNYLATKVRFAIPPIITEGLVLNLDAGNNSSYSGSGTTWTDISGYGNNATLVNGPTYSAANAGCITYDGTNDYATFYAPALGSVATIEMWAKITDTNNKMLFGFYYYDVWFYTQMGFNTANSDIYGISAATISSLGLVNNWKHYVFVMRTDVAYTNNKIYINATSQSLSQQSAAELSSNRNFNSGNGKIASWGGTDRFMPMDLSLFRIYNRELSAAEIYQNFNANRSRFGV